MADASESEPFGNGKRTPEMVSQKAAQHVRDFVQERTLELFDIRSYIPDFWLPRNSK